VMGVVGAGKITVGVVFHRVADPIAGGQPSQNRT
jgi:hypothetical protein